MLKHSVLLTLFLVSLVYAIPEIDRSLGVPFVSVPEGGYDEARRLAIEFLDDYLGEYALGDAEPLLGYDCGMDYVGLAFIVATRLDRISWIDYYSWNKEYLEHFEGVTQLFIDNPSFKPDLSDPYLSIFSKLKELEDNFFVLSIGFIESGPVVLSCTSVPASFNYKNTYPSFSTDDPQIKRTDYIFLMRHKEMSACVEPTNLYYIYQYIEIEDEFTVNGKPINHPLFKDSKPLFFENWSISNCFSSTGFSRLDIPPQDEFVFTPDRTFKQKYPWDCYFAVKCTQLANQSERLFFSWNTLDPSSSFYQSNCYALFILVINNYGIDYVWGSGEEFLLVDAPKFDYGFKDDYFLGYIWSPYDGRTLEYEDMHITPDFQLVCNSLWYGNNWGFGEFRGNIQTLLSEVHYKGAVGYQYNLFNVKFYDPWDNTTSDWRNFDNFWGSGCGVEYCEHIGCTGDFKHKKRF